MIMKDYRQLVLELISEGFNTTPALTAELRQRGASFGCRKISPMPVNKRSTHGPPLQQAIKYLCHNRRIFFDRKAACWAIVERGTYHPPEPMEKLIERHSKTIPRHIDRRILLL